MTPEEKQEIVQAVIAALKTNGKTIMQMTEVVSLQDNDYFEVSGSRRVSYAYLYGNLIDATTGIIDTYTTNVNVAIAGKLSWYDVTWIDESTTSLYTVENWNALADAIAAKDHILYKNNVAIASRHANMLRVVVNFYFGYRQAEIWLIDGVVTVEWDDRVQFSDNTSVTNLTSRVATVENSLSALTGDMGSLNLGYLNEDDPAFSGIDNVANALDLIIHNMKEVYCTKEEYDIMVEAGTIDEDTKYFIYEE
jgi:uncharacterized membrane protein